MMHPFGGSMASGSTKQKLNTRSSTIAKLVAVDDFLSKVLWVKKLPHQLNPMPRIYTAHMHQCLNTDNDDFG